MTRHSSTFKRKLMISMVLTSIGLLLSTATVGAMQTTYDITATFGIGTGSFTLDQPIGSTPTAFLGFAIEVGNDSFISRRTFGTTQSCATSGCSFSTFNQITLKEMQFLVDFGIGRWFAEISPFSTVFTPETQGTFTERAASPAIPPPAPIPEPTTIALFATGLLGLAGYRWHQRRREGMQLG